MMSNPIFGAGGDRDRDPDPDPEDPSTSPDSDRRPPSSELLCEIACQLEDVFYIETHEGKLSYVSPSALRVWGLPPSELCGEGFNWLETLDPADRVSVLAAHRAVDLGKPCDVEYRVRHRDGSVRWVRDRAFAAPEGLEPGGLIGVVQDVTDEHQLADEVAQAHKMEVLGMLASSVAHDFRNVLHAIAGSLELVLRDQSTDENAARYLRIASRAAAQGVELTNHLMEFSRKRSHEAHEVALDPLVSDAAAILELLVGDHVDLELALGAGDSALRGVPVRIEQILLNLSVNGAEAMPAGGRLLVRTAVEELDEATARRLGVASAGRYLRLDVEDEGVGMDDETRRRIFEPFFTRRRSHGTGLGLFTVLEAVKELAGQVRVDSAPGRGTCFSVYFPECGAPASRTRESDVEPGALSGSVLLIEDDRLARATTRALLEEVGLEVLEASGPHEALALCDGDRGRVDFIVCDVLMPKMPGPQLVERLRDKLPEVPVLYISARGGDELSRQGIVGADDQVLGKPFDRRSLAAKLNRCRQDARSKNFR